MLDLQGWKGTPVQVGYLSVVRCLLALSEQNEKGAFSCSAPLFLCTTVSNAIA
jgi:hypothetical protein